MTDPRKLWQEQDGAVQVLSPDAVRRASAKLVRRAQWRVWQSYLAALVWMPLMFAQAYTSPPPLIRWGSILLVLGGFFSIWQQTRHLRERRAVETPDFLETYRRQLIKERDFLRYHQKRHLLPFVPGCMLILAGAVALDASPIELAVHVGVLTLLFLSSLWLQGRAVRKVQDELDAIGGEP